MPANEILNRVRFFVEQGFKEIVLSGIDITSYNDAGLNFNGIVRYILDKCSDEVEFFGPKLEATEFEIKEILDENNNNVDAARHPKEILKFKCPIKLNKYDMMRLKLFDIKDYL